LLYFEETVSFALFIVNNGVYSNFRFPVIVTVPPTPRFCCCLPQDLLMITFLYK